MNPKETVSADIALLPVTIKSTRGNPDTRGELRIQEWKGEQRLKRALKWGGFCWLCAVFAIPMAIVHFVLVPGFLIAGPIVFVKLLSVEKTCLGGEGECPECHQTFHIEKSSFHFPMKDICNLCRASVLVEVPPDKNPEALT